MTASTPPELLRGGASPQHRWDVPERYNIAADVCDKHPRTSSR